MQNYILFEQDGPIARMNFNLPETHHSFNAEMINRFCELVSQIANDSSISVVLLSSLGDKSFCSGGDVPYFKTLKTTSAVEKMSQKMTAALTEIQCGNTLYIAEVNGNAYGGGCEILTACHFRLAANNVHFSFRQAANGIFTGWGGGQRLFKLIRPNDALRLFLTSDKISAQEALRIHFVDGVYPQEILKSEAEKLAHSIANQPQQSIQAFLKLRNAICAGEENIGDLEQKQFVALWFSDDFQNWLKNFK